MSSGLDTPTTIGGSGAACGAARIEFFLSDKDGASELRARGGGEVYSEISQRLRNLFSVRIELSYQSHPNPRGEWIVLTGSSRDDLQRAKEYILTSFVPRCRVELASSSIDIATTVSSSHSSLSSRSSSPNAMAHAVQNHYDGPQPQQLPPLTSSTPSCSSYSSGGVGSGGGGTAANLYSRSSSLSPPYQSPSPSSQTSLEHHHSYHQPHHHHQNYHHHVPTTSTSPYHPPNIDMRSREEPTPVTSTLDSEEQLRNAILQLPPEKLKNLLLDATMASGRHRGGSQHHHHQQQFPQQQQQQQQVPPSSSSCSSSASGARMMQHQHHGYVSGNSGVGGGAGGHMLLSRSPDQREKKIDYFVNTLNYPREKVESVLDQLGPEAADNDILERLVKVCRPGNVQVKASASSSVGGGGGHARPAGGPGKYAPASASIGMSGVGDSVPPRSQLSPPPPMASVSAGAVAMVTAMPATTDPARLRHIVIDGSNVAMRHGSGNFYSCRGIQLAVDYFRRRGHNKITVFVPEWRKEASKPETPITEQDILHKLEKEDVLKYTPSRRIRGKRVACYDDRFILDLATHEDGVIVSNDQFRDLMDDKPEWREVIETRLLPFQFVDDYFMIAHDPMGKDGPTLDQVLLKNPKDFPGKQLKPPSHNSTRQICPYLEKCTFGRKCKFYHPERDQRNETMGAAATGSTPQNSMSPISSRTPNASRSTTPSPSPEKWSQGRYSNSNRSSGEDLRQLHSNNGSMDDLSHYQGGGAGAGTMELAELMQGQLRLQDATQQQQLPGGGGYFHHPRPVPPNSMNLNPPNVGGGGGGGGIHSAPVFSTNSTDSAASTPAGGDSQQQHLPHRYTFPMAVIPQPHHVKSSRTHIHTEHHHPSSTMTPGGAGGMGGATTGVGGGATLQGHEIGYSLGPPHHHLQLQQDPAAAVSHHHHHSQQLQQQPPTMPGMFMTRDSWQYPPTAATPHEMHHPHVHGGGGGSLMQAQAGFYPPPPPLPNQQGGTAPASQLQPPDPPGYNSRAAVSTGTGSSGISESSSHLLPHSMGSSVITVPVTHTSPYHHHHHQSQQQPHLVQADLHQQHQHRHHSSVDYALHSQSVSPHRKRSYSNDVHKQSNGHLQLPQAMSSPALMVGGGGGGPYNYDYAAIPPGTCGSTGSGRPSYLGHQSSSTASAFYAHSAHHLSPPPPPPPSASAPTHYNHRLAAMNEGMSLNMEVFRKLSALFPGCDDRILTVMTTNPHVLDIEKLVPLIQQ